MKVVKINKQDFLDKFESLSGTMKSSDLYTRIGKDYDIPVNEVKEICKQLELTPKRFREKTVQVELVDDIVEENVEEAQSNTTYVSSEQIVDAINSSWGN